MKGFIMKNKKCNMALHFFINKALDKLYQNDKYLINIYAGKNNTDKHVSERSIVFRFGVYLEPYVLSYLPKYNLDVEYNRNADDIKRVGNKPVVPDLIIHRRGNNISNLLVLEFKTWWNSNRQNDEYKIKGFKEEYGYKYGATVLIARQRENCGINWI